MTFTTSSFRWNAVVVLCAMIIVCLGTASFAQNVHREGGAASSMQKQKLSRPMLLFTAEKLERLRRRIDEDKLFSNARDKLLKRADRLLEAELVSKEYAEGGAGQHGNYGRPSRVVRLSI